MEFNVNHRQSIQALNDQVDALRSQLEEIRLEPTPMESQDNVVGDSESTNSSLGSSHLPYLNIIVQQSEDEEMEEANEHTKSPH